MQPQTARWTAPDVAVKGPDRSLALTPWKLNPYQFVDQSPTQFWDPDGQEGKAYLQGKFYETYDRLYTENIKNCLIACGSGNEPTADQVYTTYYNEHPNDPDAREYYSKRAWGDVTERMSKEVTFTIVGGEVARIPGIRWVLGKAESVIGWGANKALGAGRSVIGRIFGKAATTAATKVVRFGPMNEGPLIKEIANTFRSGTYNGITLGEPVTLYRAYGGKAGQLGHYWTRTPPSGPVQSIVDSALDRQWGNTATQVVKVEVPAGTTIYEGPAAAQGGLVGGGDQVYIENVDPSWVKP